MRSQVIRVFAFWVLSAVDEKVVGRTQLQKQNNLIKFGITKLAFTQLTIFADAVINDALIVSRVFDGRFHDILSVFIWFQAPNGIEPHIRSCLLLHLLHLLGTQFRQGVLLVFLLALG